MISDDLVANSLSRHIRTLGICWTIYGIIRLAAAVWLVTFSGTATVMFGALLNRVPDPFSMMSVFHVIYTLIVVWSVVCGVLGLLAGWALLAGKNSARTLALTAGFLSLPEAPFGLMLGTFTLIVLLPTRSLHAETVALRDQSSRLTGHPSAM